MPPKVVASKKSQPPSVAVGVIQAKCSDNQSIVDQLYSIKLRIMKHTPNSQYYFTIQKAMESTKQHTIPIRTYADFIALKYVGPTIAQQITFPAAAAAAGNDTTTTTTTASSSTTTTTATVTKTKKSTKAKTKEIATTTGVAAPKRTRNEPESMLPVLHDPTMDCDETTSTTPIATTTTTIAATVIPPQQQQQQSLPKRSKKSATTKTTSSTTDKGKKQLAYEQAVLASQNWREMVQQQYERSQSTLTTVPRLQWRVVLLIDIREQWCEYIQAKCTMSGIPCESRQLPIGDMLWIAQGFVKMEPNAQPQQLVVVEFVIGTILERKTPEDLKSSIFGTRYMEQRLRLQHCGIPQIIYLMEGDIHRELYACPVSTIQTAIWETRLFMNFHVVHTNHADDTVLTLKRYHRRILQRTFPRAFQSHNHRTISTNTEALPTFHEAHSSRRRRSSISSNTNANADPQQQQQANRRRLRQRRQSLSELTFDMEPTVPFHMERFISYQELCCKIQYDRESGRQSVHHIYTAMLKQVSTIYNSIKCQTITDQYPTIHDVCAAYYESICTNHQNRIPQRNTDNNNNNNSSSKYPSAQYMVTNLSLVKDDTMNKENDDGLPKKSNTTTTTRRMVGTKQKTLGHRSSNELYIAYTGGDAYLNECVQGNPTQFDRPVVTTRTTSVTHHNGPPQQPLSCATVATSSSSLFQVPPALPASSTVATTAMIRNVVDQDQVAVVHQNNSSRISPQATAPDGNTTTQRTSDLSVTTSLIWNNEYDDHQSHHDNTHVQPTPPHYDTTGIRPSTFQNNVSSKNPEIILLNDSDDDDDDFCSSSNSGGGTNSKSCPNIDHNNRMNVVMNENHHPNHSYYDTVAICNEQTTKITLPKSYSSKRFDSDTDDSDDDMMLTKRQSLSPIDKTITTEPPLRTIIHHRPTTSTTTGDIGDHQNILYHDDDDDSNSNDESDDDSVLELFATTTTLRFPNRRPTSSFTTTTTIDSGTTTSDQPAPAQQYPPEIIVLDDE